ncbi:NAD-dependent epimerase/dehydratase family protein [Idiomarina abyssalis]|uniref:NAD-dependent epimerase/dehydratase family protein n=1 Tax=Idiomarina abyssalis TaxID=86102 RepID=UPI001CD69429|nr:NAD-dependent epimerase/dehydratase family protein [Idiomarina abyssalis]
MILVTGGRGFVGGQLIARLQELQTDFISLVRSGSEGLASFEAAMPEEPSSESLTSLVTEFGQPINTVIHCAGLAHSNLRNADYEDYRVANVILTEELAKLALNVGATKFIFLSTIGVHGRISSELISESSSLVPYDDYSRSKLKAEKCLVELFENEKRSSELVIIRPPLIVGEGAPGNLSKLIKLCDWPVPLPFGLIDNKRTVLSLENLLDFICFAQDNTDVSGIFTLADDEVLSTKEIAREIKSSLGKSRFMFPVPMMFMKILSSLVRKPHFYEQLCGDLVVDSARAKSQGWQPVVSSKASLRKASVFHADNVRKV